LFLQAERVLSYLGFDIFFGKIQQFLYVVKHEIAVKTLKRKFKMRGSKKKWRWALNRVSEALSLTDK